MEKVEIEYQSNGQPVAVDFDDLRKKLGYRVYEPKIGSMGRALIKASKSKSQVGRLIKSQLDELFKKDRQSHFKRKRTHNGKTN